MSHTSEQLKSRSRAIDILRAVSIILILGRHMDRCPAQVSPWLHRFTDLWENGGWLGVDFFFVLSGFLVSGLLFREYERHGDISPRNFLIRRGFKIYPSFWLLIVVSLVVIMLRHDRLKPWAVISELCFVQNYGPQLLAHTWSLAVEEHFYFFLALLMWLGTRIKAANHFRLLPVVFATLAVGCLLLRLLTHHTLPGFIDKLHLYPTHLRMDSLFAGVLISYYYHRHPGAFMKFARRWRWPMLVAGLALLAPGFALRLKSSPFVSTYGLTCFYTGSGLVLMAMLTVQIPRNFLASALAYVGAYSYSIYLWHVPVAMWLVPWLTGPVKAERNWFIYFAVYTLGAIGLGILTGNIVEFPMLRLRDRWFPSRTR